MKRDNNNAYNIVSIHPTTTANAKYLNDSKDLVIASYSRSNHKR